ncbi:putative oxidoreductase [Roseivirga ehrenbergii]|uniref:DoxX family protein n=1 Tax=Roseivirga ehrenbergii (strain DSM 102268 / JCM 13514 / KCTC 12282 / NCIMB 14502 / KMM 6017) TaxID=279360 RepID=A0A150XK50_ROSEK|nr:DoxX family protein [Roseivirga ehrenbergii]KYG79118.1 DoxX family protein [Roseivirga ehrenbergii]TCK99085.1 putative oxidoreductase [Roseivirga ehrenbergii]
MFKKLLATGNHSSSTSTGLLILRVGLAIMMLTHGYPKFLKLIEGNFQFGDPIGLGVEVSLILAVLAEFLCSILLIVGLFSRFALVPLMVTMAVALFVVHSADPFGTQEKPAMYLLTFFFLFITGPGKYSLDQKFFGKRTF